jgi:UDP-GlcNAc3NAcA epimerase
MKKIVTIVGARPQFIKASPVSQALARAGLEEAIVHTGQHFDATMSEIFFRELAIPAPKHNLDIHSLSHGAMTGRMLEAIETVLLEEKPDMALVYGDTNSTLAGALAAVKLHIPLAHVEAGLRSFNRRMPEEINRVTADHLATLLFCPTAAAVANLAAEGLVQGVHAVGDVMFDTTLAAQARAQAQSDILRRLSLKPASYAVATLHRAENTDDPEQLARVIGWLAAATRARPVIMVVHPRTSARMTAAGLSAEGVTQIAPLGYLDMTQLVHNAAAVFTDSGGLQKEAYFHRVPCVTLREETEWVETIEAGWNRLWTGPDYGPRRDIADYGDGHAADAIAALVAAAL